MKHIDDHGMEPFNEEPASDPLVLKGRLQGDCSQVIDAKELNLQDDKIAKALVSRKEGDVFVNRNFEKIFPTIDYTKLIKSMTLPQWRTLMLKIAAKRPGWMTLSAHSKISICFERAVRDLVLHLYMAHPILAESIWEMLQCKLDELIWLDVGHTFVRGPSAKLRLSTKCPMTFLREQERIRQRLISKFCDPVELDDTPFLIRKGDVDEWKENVHQWMSIAKDDPNREEKLYALYSHLIDIFAGQKLAAETER